MKTIIEPLFDPLSSWFAQKLRFDNPYVAVGFGLLCGSVAFIWIPAIEGVLLPTQNFIASLAAWPLFLVWLVTVPLIFGYYFRWQTTNANLTFSSICESAILNASKEDVISYIQEQWTKFAVRPWWMLALLLAIIGTFLHANDAISYTTAAKIWYTVNKTTFYLFRVPIVFVSLFMVAQILFRHIGFIRTLQKLFNKFDVKIHILHPDRAGGLGYLGKHSLFMSYFLAIFALDIVILNSVANRVYRVPFVDPSMITMIVAYMVLSPAAFFLPLATAHREMKQAKEKALLEISLRSRELFEKSRQLLPNDNSVKKLSDELSALERLYSLAEKFPVWPFDTSTISRFVVAVVFPLVSSVLIEFVIKFVFGN